MYRVLFVCLGNICRSPAGEGIFKKLVKEQGLHHNIIVDSAGTSGYHNGELPDPRMRQHGARRGYKFDSLSRKFTSKDFDQFDIIIAMDDSNYHNIKRLSPNLEADEKVYRMTDFSKNTSTIIFPIHIIRVLMVSSWFSTCLRMPARDFWKR